MLSAVLGTSAGLGVGMLLTPPVAQPPTAPPAALPAPSTTPEPVLPEVASEALTQSSVRQGTRVPPPGPGPLPSPTPLVADPDARDAQGLTAADRAAGLLSTDVPETASGDLVVVAGSSPAPHPEREVRRVRVEVENGLDIDRDLFAATVIDTLNDPRGWGGDGSVSFAWTDGAADIRVVLASPGTVDQMCAPLETVGLYSCGREGRAVLNHMRWVEATEEFDDRTEYRQYLVNHEVGHLLGQPHVECPAAGEVAPIMQQQTIGVAPCVPNAWPFPDEG